MNINRYLQKMAVPPPPPFADGRWQGAGQPREGHSPGPLLMEQTFTYLDHCRIVQDLGETASWARVILGLFSSDNFSYLK